MMKVKVFDESHESDLEDAVNGFLEELDEDSSLVDIKYSVTAFLDVGGEQIYCYSALLIYKEKD